MGAYLLLGVFFKLGGGMGEWGGGRLVGGGVGGWGQWGVEWGGVGWGGVGWGGVGRVHRIYFVLQNTLLHLHRIC